MHACMRVCVSVFEVSVAAPEQSGDSFIRIAECFDDIDHSSWRHKVAFDYIRLYKSKSLRFWMNKAGRVLVGRGHEPLVFVWLKSATVRKKTENTQQFVAVVSACDAFMWLLYVGN